MEKTGHKWLGCRVRCCNSRVIYPYIYGKFTTMITFEQLQPIFLKAISERAVSSKLEGFTEDQIYNWRKKRKKYTKGEMLDVLNQLGLLTITIN